jgi:hypothetical protein
MLGVFAEFETNLRKERQMEGIAKAKAAGVYKGRPASIDLDRVRQLKAEGWGPVSDRPQARHWSRIGLSGVGMTMQATRDGITAYHEAGHAVIGHLFGHRIVSVRFSMGGAKRGLMVAGVCTTSGYTEWHRTFVVEARQTSRDIDAAIEIICLIAGMLAESKVEKATEDEWLIQDDFTQVSELLDEADIPRLLPPLLSICQRHIDSHWPQIDALAKALLADGKIVKATTFAEFWDRGPCPCVMSSRKWLAH